MQDACANDMLGARLQVEHINFDPALCVLRIKGKNTMESQHVRVRTLFLYAYVCITWIPELHVHPPLTNAIMLLA